MSLQLAFCQSNHLWLWLEYFYANQNHEMHKLPLKILPSTCNSTICSIFRTHWHMLFDNANGCLGGLPSRFAFWIGIIQSSNPVPHLCLTRSSGVWLVFAMFQSLTADIGQDTHLCDQQAYSMFKVSVFIIFNSAQNQIRSFILPCSHKRNVQHLNVA